MASIRPLQDRVLIKRVEDKAEQIRGGIIIPDTARDKPQEGEVIAVGAGKKLESGERVVMDLTEGDLVLFPKYGGQEVRVGDEEYLIMREDEVLGVIERAAKAKGKGK
jgi:chaperonin GroES